MLISAVVADTRLHAEALIRWLELDPDRWIALEYGQKLTNFYQHVRIVRPLSGVTEAHSDWLVNQLLPRVAQRRDTVPRTWDLTSLDAGEGEDAPVDVFWT